MDDTETIVYQPCRGERHHFRESERLLVFQRDRGICQICGEPVDSCDYHVDHIIPVSAGGEHHPNNWQLAHPACNRRKGGQRKSRAVRLAKVVQTDTKKRAWFTVAQIADHCQVEPRTVREWLRNGRIVGRNLGGQAGWRVRSEDLEAFIEQLETNQESKTAA